MSERITLKFKKLRLITTLSWMGILLLSLILRDVISSPVFWIVVFVIFILFLTDLIYFIIRIVEVHYLLITNQTVVLKKAFNPPGIIEIKNIKILTLMKKDNKIKQIIVSDDQFEITIKHKYTISKDGILSMIRYSQNFPETVEIVDK